VYNATEVTTAFTSDSYEDQFYFHTLEGNHHLKNGSFIVTGIQGEHYAVEKDIFEKTYEKVKENFKVFDGGKEKGDYDPIPNSMIERK
jgi:hypothetical protein